MSLELKSNSVPLTPQVTALLAGLRRRIQSLVWLQGLGLAIIWLAVSFWLTLALDWLIEPPPAARAVALVAVAAGCGWILYRYILTRAFVPLGDANLALLLERRYRNFRDSLITSVELHARPAHAEPFNRQMLAHTRDEAVAHAREVRIRDVVQSASVTRGLLIGAVLAGTIGAFAVAAPEPFRIWVNRVLLLSEDLWPRKTRLSIDGFPNKLAKVARGADLRVTVFADRAFEVPDQIDIRYRDDEGTSNAESMAQLAAGPGDELQPFGFEFKSIRTSIDFDVVGGDDRLRGYRIQMVENPTIAEMTLHCVYPAYMRRSPRDVRVTGVMQLPVGVKATLRAKANKPLEMVQVDVIGGVASENSPPAGEAAPANPAGSSGDDTPRPLATITNFTGGDQREFRLALPPLMTDMRLTFRLFDADKIVGHDPVRLDLTTQADEPPRVAVQLRGIGEAVTAQAVLPLTGEVTDDYGLRRIWFEFRSNQNLPLIAPFQTEPQGKESVRWESPATERLDLRELRELAVQTPPAAGASAVQSGPDATAGTSPDPKANPAENQPKTTAAPPGGTGGGPQRAGLVLNEGDVLGLAIRAEDECTLGAGANVGTSDRYELKVVSPDQLLAILENKEQELRTRFETIIDEFAATRDNLGSVHPGPITPASIAAVSSPSGPQPGAEPGDSGAEPGDAPSAPKSESDAGGGMNPTEKIEQLRDSRRLLVERAIENFERSAHEIEAVGNAFAEICLQLENNRIDTPELQRRLKSKISEPLLEISGRRLPVLHAQIRVVQRRLEDGVQGPSDLNLSLATADAILREMRAVLDSMLELEDYNRLIDKVRKLIEAQKQLNQQTKQQQLDKLKDLQGE